MVTGLFGGRKNLPTSASLQSMTSGISEKINVLAFLCCDSGDFAFLFLCKLLHDPLSASCRQPANARGSPSGKRFNQRRGNCLRCEGRDLSQLLQQSLPVHSAELIHRHLSASALKGHCHSRRVSSFGGGHGSDNRGLKMPVHFVRRHNQARSCLLHFRSPRGIERYEPDLILSRATHHFHSL